jgi:uncharacterized phage protein (TIGR02218 family)
MTYDAKENSVYEGSPVELYQFARGTAEYWRYTSADADETYLGGVYSAVAISRNKIELSQNVQTASLQIEVPIDTAFAQEFMAGSPTDPISFTLFRFHEGDAEVASIWIGRVVNVEFKELTVDVLCETSYTSLKRPTLRRLYQYTCPHVLYDEGPGLCNVDKDNFKTTATLSAVSGVTITSATFGLQADTYYSGGFVELTTGGVINRRFITNHVGNDLTLNQVLFGAASGMSVDVYPGCAHNLDTCRTKFNNLVNYGGFPWIPQKNPFGGAPIF